MPSRPPSPPSTHRRVIAHHLIFHAYGQWLPNDPRGSGSTLVRKPELRPLGPAHLGRRPPHEQPDRSTLRDFYQQVNPRLEHDVLWFDERLREVIAASLAQTIRAAGYTAYACAVCANHAHLCVRVHRDRGDVMWKRLADDARGAVRDAVKLPAHPIWADRPYSVFKDTPAAVRSCVRYIQENPAKEGLAAQPHPFVVPYDGWPFHAAKTQA
jgi:hypothetical protein